MSRNIYELPELATPDDTDLVEVYQQTDNTYRRLTAALAAIHHGRELQKVVTVTSAQLLALNATAIEIIPAPGAGLALVPTFWAARIAAGTAYAGIAAGEDLTLRYTNASGALASVAIETTGFLDQTTAQLRAAGGVAASVTPVANAAIVAHLLTGEITTGDTDLEVLVRYRIIATDFAGA